MNRKTNRDIQRSIRVIALVAMAAFCVSSCAEPTGTSAPQSPPAATYNIATQSDYDEAKSRIYNGGDEILFERGRSFEGAFSLRRSDVGPDSTITIADFGSSDAPRPAITTDAEGMGVIDIRDSGGWTIENLELVNRSATRSERMGIYVTATDSGFHQNFVVRNCLIHDVTGEPVNKDNGGIIFRIWGREVPTKFDNILLENNEIRDISGVGIRIKSPWEADPSDPRQGSDGIGRHAFQNVVLRGNRVSNITKNAIIVASSDSPLVEYNVMGPNISTEFTGNSFFNFATDNALIQYNEAYGNVGPAGDKDRGGFDADWNARNTVFQYNYSHDNNYAFAIMRRYHDGLRILHNISENERYGFFFYGFPTENRIIDIEISNNTFYSMYPDMQMFMNVGRQREPVNSSFFDNIFVFAAGGATWGAEPSPKLGNFFENNLVFGLDEVNYTGPAGDPLLAAPGTGGTGIDMSDPDRLSGYKLCIGSPAIGAGRSAENIGAHSGDGVDCTSTASSSPPPQDNPHRVVYDGTSGPGTGKHVVLIAGDHEYRSEEILPALGRILARNFGFKASVFFTLDADGFIEPGSSRMAGLEALQTADLLVIGLRFQDFPDAEMRHVVDYVDRGGPVVGIRTSTHAFRIADGPFAKYTWDNKDPDYAGGFGRQILGETWVGHYGTNHQQSSLIVPVADQIDHPILRGVRDVHVQSGGYRAVPIPGSAILARGTILNGMAPDAAPDPDKERFPVVWTRTYDAADSSEARVVTTTHGASEDFVNNGFRRLLVNASLWAAGLESAITGDLDVSLVGPYHPVTYSFDGYRRGVRPADMAGWDTPIMDQSKPTREPAGGRR